MMFVFPPIMYLRALQKKVKEGGKPAPGNANITVDLWPLFMLLADSF